MMCAGEEIVSGAQRIHDVTLLTERAEHWKVGTRTLHTHTCSQTRKHMYACLCACLCPLSSLFAILFSLISSLSSFLSSSFFLPFLFLSFLFFSHPFFFFPSFYFADTDGFHSELCRRIQARCPPSRRGRNRAGEGGHALLGWVKAMWWDGMGCVVMGRDTVLIWCEMIWHLPSLSVLYIEFN